MKIKLKKWLSALLAATLIAGCAASFPVTSFALEDTTTKIDVADIGKGTVVEHTHIYQCYYDDYNHWDQCIICGDKKNVEAHHLEGNGGSKTLCENGYYDSAYREVCICGYKSKPQVVIHGRYANYVNCQTLNYGNMSGVKLSDIKQITQAEYNSISYPALPGGQSYSWEDPDGDGYGWVFCGGPILADSNGVIGTVQSIVGTEGDCGRCNAFEEYYALTDYIYSDGSPTRGEFISYLNNKVNSSANPTLHSLYGYSTKYSNISDDQFNALVSEFRGYFVHIKSYGWGSMNIQHEGHLNSGTWIYAADSCYDSNKDANVTWSSGIDATCDVCGCHANGNEDYINDTWYICNCGNGLKDGETRTCSGHTLYGAGNTELGTVYCTFTRSGHTVTRTLKAVPVSGGSASGGGASWSSGGDGSIYDTAITCDHTDQKVVRDYTYVHTVTFTKGSVTRLINCGYYFILNDDTVPSAYGYDNITSSNSYWKVEGDGTEDNLSTDATLTVTFSDPDQYSLNTMCVRLYDSDGTTLLKQVNGNTDIPLYRISGSAGTSGGTGIWHGTVDICAEVNGSKLIFVQAVDSTGNVSEKIPIQIQYLDAKGPEIKIISSENLDTWSQEKKITIQASDAFGTVYLGTCNEDLKLISNDTYENKRTYVISGESAAGVNSITFYAKDSAGNVTFETVNFSSLDNTDPVINSAEVSDVFSGGEAVSWKIAVDAADNASGIAGIAITTSTDAPDDADYGSVSEFQIPVSGIYYIWLKDNAGNVTRSDAITVHSDLIYNGTEIHASDYNETNLKCVYYNGKRIRL